MLQLNGSRKPMVLICEDELYIHESIRYVVEKAGFNCAQAGNGNEAYEKAHAINPDLIILDVGMSGMTGFEVCERLRSKPAFTATKIIVLSAFGQAVDEQKAREVGADRFIVKPFSPRILMETLGELLS
jgi:two-component system alkaline phosphatase synthesis response regulator PhoP